MKAISVSLACTTAIMVVAAQAQTTTSTQTCGRNWVKGETCTTETMVEEPSFRTKLTPQEKANLDAPNAQLDAHIVYRYAQQKCEYGYSGRAR
jgi:hypothetical protein